MLIKIFKKNEDHSDIFGCLVLIYIFVNIFQRNGYPYILLSINLSTIDLLQINKTAKMKTIDA